MLLSRSLRFSLFTTRSAAVTIANRSFTVATISKQHTNTATTTFIKSTQQLCLRQSSHDAHGHDSHSSRPAWINPAIQELPVPAVYQEISINVITMDGHRFSVVGAVGDRLMDSIHGSLEGSNLIPGRCDGGGDSEKLYGEGPSCRSCYVYVDPDSLAKLPAKEDSEQILSLRAHMATEHTRFSCEIILQPELDGMTIVIPEYKKGDLI